MQFKKFATVLALTLLASAASAHQNGPQPGTHITVAKPASDIGDYSAAYFTVQAAVNAAKPGQVIEILDEAVYNEQVTIDGREDSPWAGVTGGKHGITLKYTPAAGTAARPSIVYRDTVNRSPKTVAEAQTSGDSPGRNGNWETCAALRILRTSGITVEGIIVDGGGSAPFAWPNIWNARDPLFHGNAAISVVVSGNVQIRDCELRNAYFGVFFKDRNTGGVFANPNPDDVDITVPLSGFGKTGNHLFEYNKVHDNDVGMYFESSWDLGSTVRYNLIYSNYHKLSNMPAAAYSDNWTAGAIMFKDTYLSPVAIYNNTLYDNTMNLIGNWQVGYQHLVFNNIFSKLRPVTSSSSSNGYASHMSLDGMFPQRMKHCVFAANYGGGGSSNSPFSIQNQSGYLCPPDDVFIYSVMFENFRGISISGTQVSVPRCLYGEPDGYTSIQKVLPGALITGGLNPIPAAANIRWLEMTGGTYTSGGTSPVALTLPSLFKSIDTLSPDFLVPDWEAQEVKDFIRNGGWRDGGILNADGTVADLGAIPFGGKRPCDGVAQTSRARVSPYGVVMVSGTTAMAKINITSEIGTLSNLTLKYIRWINPIPDNTDSYGADGDVIPAAAVKTVTAAAPAGGWQVGGNQVNITATTTGTYGFFEVVFEGKDGIGRTVATDVGFLPYRQLGHYLDIKALKGSTAVTEVQVGEPVTLSVTAMDRATNAQYTAGVGTTPLQVEYALNSDPTARMWQAKDPFGDPLTSEPDLRVLGTAAYTKAYTVYFSRSGSEIVTAAGLWSGATPLPFLGDLRLKVRSGAPDRVVFLNPISKNLLPAGVSPPVASGYYAVQVQARDRYGNPSDTSVNVALRVLTSGVAEVVPTAAKTDSVTGIAEFTVRVTGGAEGEIFDLEALMIHGDVMRSDTASLTVGAPPPPEGSPQVVAGGYDFDGGVIRSLSLTFDRAASNDWFSSVQFAFGGIKGTLTNMACVAVDGTNAKSVSISFDCAFPGTPIPETLAKNSEITINFSGSKGWAPLTITITDGAVSVLAPDRKIPAPPPKEEATVIAPVVILAGEFTAGPNPISKQSGIVKFYRQGRRVNNCELRVYDATGNHIKKIKIKDNAIGTQAKRIVGSWDLTDRKGRTVSDGTYLVKGVLKTSDGKVEKVSVILSVR